MNKEQIEWISEQINYCILGTYADAPAERTKEQFRILDGFSELRNQALNSIPRKFDSEDKTTWPEKEGPYLVRYKKDDPDFQFDVCRWTDFGELEIAGKKIGFGWRGNPYQDSVVTDYMPIPEELAA